MSDSHYETLEVAEGAPPEAVRRAYYDLARRLHPDRWANASRAERVEAERRMQEVNEAWRVLGNAGRRIAYDQDRAQPIRSAKRADLTGDGFSFSTGSLIGDDLPEPTLAAKLVRLVPWAAVALVLLVIFVFTAYAGGPVGTGAEGSRCIAVDGGSSVEVPCGSTGARQVVKEVEDVGQCPAETEPFQPDDRRSGYCLVPLPATSSP